MVTPATIEIARGPDTRTATRVVDPTGAVGTDLTLVAALANLPAGGGSIALVGVDETAPAGGFTIPNKPVHIFGTGVKSSILRPAAGDLLFNMAFDNRYDFNDFTAQGDGSAGQVGWDYGAAVVGNEYTRIRHVDALNIEKIIRVNAAAYPLVSCASCAFKVRSNAASRHWAGGSGSFEVIDCFFTGIAGNQGGIDGQPDLYLTNSFLRYPQGIAAFTMVAVGCNFNAGGTITINGTYAGFFSVISGCNIDTTATRAIDLVAAADKTAIVGNTFTGWTSEAVRLAASDCVVSGNRNCKVTETAGADNNVYDGLSVTAGSTFVGAGSRLENQQVRATAIDITLDESHRVVVVDASGANRTITLPTAASAKWRVYTVKKIDASANTVTIDGDGAETIDDAATQVLAAQYESLTIISDGTEWWVV